MDCSLADRQPSTTTPSTTQQQQQSSTANTQRNYHQQQQHLEHRSVHYLDETVSETKKKKLKERFFPIFCLFKQFPLI